MQIRFGAQFHKTPIRKLPAQRSSKMLAILEPCPTPGCIAVGGISQIEQR